MNNLPEEKARSGTLQLAQIIDRFTKKYPFLHIGGSLRVLSQP
jgi:hypothetical protein